MTYLQPFYPALVLGALAGLVLHWRAKPGRKPWLLTLALAGLILFSWPPVAWLLSGTLEWWYPDHPSPAGDAEAIVVLAGAVDDPRPDRPWPLLGYDTYLRCQHAAWLFRRWHQVPVLACGGRPSTGDDGTAFSQTIRQALEGEGVSGDMIWIEDASTSTYENARYAAEMLRERGVHRVALVTDSISMWRAEACFRRAGVAVTPAPCGFRSGPFEFRIRTFLPCATAIRQNEEALHEWVGLAWYALRGRI